MSGQSIASEVDAALGEVAQEVGTGSFTVTLLRAAVAPNPWDPPVAGDPQEFTLRAMIDQWKWGEVDGSLIRATDKKVMVSATGAVPTVADRLIISTSPASATPPATFTVEDVSGTKDGANTAFTISGSGVVALFLNGVRQVAGVDYERSGPMITATGSIPNAGDTYVAEIYTSGNPPTIEDVSGTKDGVNASFTVTKDGTVALFLNGVRQVEGVDYTRDGTNITAITIPGPGDSYKAVIYASASGVEFAIMAVIPEAPSGVPLYYIIHARQ